ncbi:MAG: efflux RND transporter periplasmic adaptor subunit [Bdellovibrio sp.]|nr:efflux RND transporter periplasmic adaptor subunit [Bdellovibrio sp.]
MLFKYRSLTLPVLCLLMIMNTAQAASEKTSPNKTPPKTVKAVKAATQVFFESYTYPARIEFDTLAQVKTPVEGEVVELKTFLGQQTKRGQILAVIKNTDPLFQYKTARIVAPLDGVVTEILISDRSEVSKDQVIMKVARTDAFTITAEVPAIHLDYFKNYPQGALVLSNQNAKISIKMKGLAPQIDPATGTAQAKFMLSDKAQSKLITPGRLAQVTFKGPEQKGIVIPEIALNYKGKKTLVAVVENKIYSKKEITLGEKRDGQVLITSGLKEGELVVERASGYIPDGATVEIVE